MTALASEVAGLTRRFDNWIFVISPYKYANMDKSKDDLLKPPAMAKPEATKAPEKTRTLEEPQAGSVDGFAAYCRLHGLHAMTLLAWVRRRTASANERWPVLIPVKL